MPYVVLQQYRSEVITGAQQVRVVELQKKEARADSSVRLRFFDYPWGTKQTYNIFHTSLGYIRY